MRNLQIANLLALVAGGLMSSPISHVSDAWATPPKRRKQQRPAVKRMAAPASAEIKAWNDAVDAKKSARKAMP